MTIAENSVCFQSMTVLLKFMWKGLTLTSCRLYRPSYRHANEPKLKFTGDHKLTSPPPHPCFCLIVKEGSYPGPT